MLLDDWLNLIFNPPAGKVFISGEFPTDRHRDEYLETISNRNESEIYLLLYRFLIKTGSFTIDELRLEALIFNQQNFPEENELALQNQYYKRLILYKSGKSDIPPWEGLTWVLDLLPHFPGEAINAVSAYILAHAQVLPDARYRGLYDAIEVIRAKFIGLPGTRGESINLLKNLSSRDFEHLVERLYVAMGYETVLTPKSKDGGRDIIAQRQKPAQHERLLVECKKYEHNIGIQIARALLGVVTLEKVTKGVIVTTSDFTRDVRKFASENFNLELINGDELVGLMNEYLGAEWVLHIDRLIIQSQSGRQINT